MNLFSYPYVDDRKVIDSVVQCLLIDVEEPSLPNKSETGGLAGKDGKEASKVGEGREAPEELILVLKSLCCIAKNPSCTEKIINARIRTDPRDTTIKSEGYNVFVVLRDLAKKYAHADLRIKIADLVVS